MLVKAAARMQPFPSLTATADGPIPSFEADVPMPSFEADIPMPSFVLWALRRITLLWALRRISSYQALRLTSMVLVWKQQYFSQMKCRLSRQCSYHLPNRPLSRTLPECMCKRLIKQTRCCGCYCNRGNPIAKIVATIPKDYKDIPYIGVLGAVIRQRDMKGLLLTVKQKESNLEEKRPIIIRSVTKPSTTKPSTTRSSTTVPSITMPVGVIARKRPTELVDFTGLQELAKMSVQLQQGYSAPGVRAGYTITMITCSRGHFGRNQANLSARAALQISRDGEKIAVLTKDPEELTLVEPTVKLILQVCTVSRTCVLNSGSQVMADSSSKQSSSCAVRTFPTRSA